MGLFDYKNPTVQEIQLCRRSNWAGDFNCAGDPNVGAGLLAKAVCQSRRCRMTLRFREQARSHRYCVHMIFEGHHKM